MRHNVPAKSVLSQKRSLVRFFNVTNRSVAIIWLDFKGNQIPYKILDPTDFVDVTTFVNHPWIFLDTQTGDRLMANRSIVYYPECWSETKRRLPEQYANLSEGRLVVPITVPLYSLRDRCMLVVRDCVQSIEAISELEVPLSIKSDLMTMFLKKDLFVQKQFRSIRD